MSLRNTTRHADPLTSRNSALAYHDTRRCCRRCGAFGLGWSSPSQCQDLNFRLHRPQFSHQLMPSRSWIYSWRRRQQRPMRRENMWAGLSPLVHSVIRECNLSMWKMKLRRWITLAKAMRRRQERPLLSHEDVPTDRKNEATNGAVDWSRTSCWFCHDPFFVTPNWLGALLELSAYGITTAPLAKRSVVSRR